MTNNEGRGRGAARILRLACFMWLAGMLGLTGVAWADTPRQARGEAFREVDCETFELTDAEWECGYVRVPAFHDAPEGETLELAVAVLPSTGATPTRNALVMAQGGPGGSTIDLFGDFWAQGYFPALEDMRAERDIVLFEQRGTLYSQPALLCPEELEYTVKNLEVWLSPEENLRGQAQAGQACRARLVSEGVNLAAFNSVENAKDLEDVRRALGYEKFDLYGVSYGTLLAQHAMRETPQTLRSVILDAVVPTAVNPNAEIATSQNRAFETLFAACAADTDCSRAYPDLKRMFYDTVAALDRQPARVRITDDETGKNYNAVVDGDTFVNLMFQFIYNTEVIPLLPKIISDAHAGRFELFGIYYALVVFDRTFASAMYHAVMCAEDADFTVGDLTLEGVEPYIANAQKRDTQAFLEFCADWNAPQLGARADEAVRSEIPALLFSGKFDPITPPPNGVTTAETLEIAYPFVFEAYGHGAFTSGDCAGQIMVEFVRDPTARPNADCLAEANRLEFATPATYFLSDALGVFNYAILQGRFGVLLVPFGLLLIVGSVWLVAPIVWIVQRSRGKSTKGNVGTLAAPWLAAGVSALGGIFLTGVVVLLFVVAVQWSDLIPLLTGAPREWLPWFMVVPVVLILTVLLMVAVIVGWRSANWGWGRRIYYAVVALAAIGLVGWMWANGMVVGV